MACFVTDDLVETKEKVLKNCHGDVIRPNEIGDVEFRRKDGSGGFYVSRQDLGILVKFLVEVMDERLDD